MITEKGETVWGVGVQLKYLQEGHKFPVCPVIYFGTDKHSMTNKLNQVHLLLFTILSC